MTKLSRSIKWPNLSQPFGQAAALLDRSRLVFSPPPQPKEPANTTYSMQAHTLCEGRLVRNPLAEIFPLSLVCTFSPQFFSPTGLLLSSVAGTYPSCPPSMAFTSIGPGHISLVSGAGFRDTYIHKTCIATGKRCTSQMRAVV
jgi:hypothetical protein